MPSDGSAAPATCILRAVSPPAPAAAIERSSTRPLLSIGLVLCLAAGVGYFSLAPLVNRMPETGVDETTYPALIRSRDTPTGDWIPSTLVSHRVDRTLLASSRHVVIQGDLNWSAADGTPAFETSGIYGVDRRTRMNLPGYGNVERAGLFLFPLHTERRDYRYWDPGFIGPRSARFDRTETVDGLTLLVFRFTARDLDETSGYIHLPDVPERYEAHSDGDGWLWIEPTSGTLVDFQETGDSFFVEPKTGRRIAGFFHWRAAYDAPTRAAKLAQALKARRRIIATETVVPAGLLLLGVLALLLGGWRRWQRRAHAAPLQGPAR